MQLPPMIFSRTPIFLKLIRPALHVFFMFSNQVTLLVMIFNAKMSLRAKRGNLVWK